MKLEIEQSEPLTLERQVLENLRQCALAAKRSKVPELEWIFGGTYLAAKAGNLEELATIVSRFMMDKSLTAPIEKRLSDR